MRSCLTTIVYIIGTSTPVDNIPTNEPNAGHREGRYFFIFPTGCRIFPLTPCRKKRTRTQQKIVSSKSPQIWAGPSVTPRIRSPHGLNVPLYMFLFEYLLLRFNASVFVVAIERWRQRTSKLNCTLHGTSTAATATVAHKRTLCSVLYTERFFYHESTVISTYEDFEYILL